MTIARIDQEIEELHLEFLESLAGRGMAMAAENTAGYGGGYDQGVADTLDWLTGNSDTRPGDEPEHD